MADRFDVTKMSDEELEAYASGLDITQAPPGEGARVRQERVAATRERAARIDPPPTAEQIEPSSIKRGLAAVGGAMQEPFLGIAEKFQLAFPGSTPSAAEATRARIGEERTARRTAQRQLEDTPAGQFGGFVGKAAPFAAAGPTAIGQAAMAGALGFAGGGPDAPDSLSNELINSAFTGAADAATTGIAVKGLQTVAKGLSGARGRFTEEGARAMATDAAAKRLGIPSPTIGQLSPNAVRALQAPDDLVARQAAAMEKATGKAIQLPEGEVMQTGGAYLDELTTAVKNRLALGSEKYSAVDQFIDEKGLQPLLPRYTANMATATKTKGYDLAADAMEKYGFPLRSMEGMTSKELGNIPLTMTNMHEMRVAANRALRFMDRMAEAPSNVGRPDINDARKFLRNFKDSIDSDMGQWAKLNKGNADAVKIYEDANKYWRDVVGPTVSENPLAKKILSRSRGFDVPVEAISASTSTKGTALTDLLRPTMSRRGEDMTAVLRNLPDVRATMLGAPQQSAMQGGLETTLAATGHPLQALMNKAPGLSSLSRLPVMKWSYFGKPAPGAAVGPAAQYPAGGLEEWSRERIGAQRGR